MYIINPINYSSEHITDSNVSNVHSKAFKYNYYGTICFIKNLLERAEINQNEEDRTAVTEKLFEHLLSNYNILVYEPTFRNIVINKIKDIEMIIYTRNKLLANAKFDEAFNMLKKSTSAHITHSTMRNKVNAHISCIVEIMNQYKKWVLRDPLKQTIDSLKILLNEIKNHPDYVS